MGGEGTVVTLIQANAVWELGRLKTLARRLQIDLQEVTLSHGQ